MRPILKHLAWGLATAALAVATPLRTIGSAPLQPAASGAVTAVQAPAPAVLTSGGAASASPMAFIPGTAVRTQATGALSSEYGGGWTEVQCAICVGAGAAALYAGGITMLPLILANPAAYGTLTGLCLHACRSVLQELMK